MLRVNNLTGFGGAGVKDITIVDDGDSTAESAGTGTATHTHSSETTTGPVSVVTVHWKDGSDQTLNSMTWGGNAITILVQRHRQFAGVAIGIISGAQTGDVVLNFSGTTDMSGLTKLSLTYLQSLTAVDTDSDVDDTLTALTSPGVGGIRIAASTNASDATAYSWTNATEVSDFICNSARASAAYDLGDSATTITGDAAESEEVIVGVSLR